MPCDRENLVNAYYDGALSAADRAAFEAHLQGCDECRQSLAAMARVSRMLNAAPLSQMPGDLSGRIVNAFPAARDKQNRERDVRRLAGWLTATAAAVLLVAIFRLPGASRPSTDQVAENPPAARDWELAAVMPPPERTADDAGSAEFVQLAQWMSRDLAVSSDGRR